MVLDPHAHLTALLQALVDIESVSGNEVGLADQVEQVLAAQPHLSVDRNGDTVVARTQLGRGERVVIAGHLDTVPVAGNLPSRLDLVAGVEAVIGRGSCDMKGGVAVALKAACEITAPVRDVTWIFYDNEEVDSARNGLGRVGRENPDWLAADFAVLMEPTSATVEGGCQGTLRIEVSTKGTAAHSARAWMGHNAIHDLARVIERIEQYPIGEVEVDGLMYREGLNAVAVSGGIAGNVIPDQAAVAINFRYAPDKDAGTAEAAMRAHFADWQVRLLDNAGGARPGLDLPAAKAFVEAVGAQPRAKYGWTDVARFSALGVPAVNFGPGDPSKAHADDEFCPTEDLQICHQALTRWLSEES